MKRPDEVQNYRRSDRRYVYFEEYMQWATRFLARVFLLFVALMVVSTVLDKW